MKQIEVTIGRRVATTYQYAVDDDFDVHAPNAFAAVEAHYFDGEFGSEDEVTEEVWNWDVEYVAEVQACK